MGWKDAPEASGDGGGGWRDAPEAEAHKKPRHIGTGRASAIATLQGLTGDFADEIGGLYGKALLPESNVKLGAAFHESGDEPADVRALKNQALEEEASRPTNYQMVRDSVREDDDAAKAKLGGYYDALKLAGGVATAPLLPGVGEGKTLLQLATTGAKLGGAIGATAALGSSRADLTTGDLGNYWDATKDVAGGAAAGAGAGFVAPYAARGVEKVVGKFTGRPLTKSLAAKAPVAESASAPSTGEMVSEYAGGALVKPTKEAQTLIDAGIDNMTVAQHNPGHPLAQVEEVAMSTGPFGKIIEKQRRAPAEKWQNGALSEAIAPGGTIPIQGSTQERLAGIYKGYQANYDSIRKAPLSERAVARPPNVTRLKKALNLAAEDPNVLATGADVESVKRFLGNQASLAEKHGATPGVLLKIRENIRRQGAQIGPEDARRQLFERAERTVTNRLEYSLPAEQLKKLRLTDAKYRNYKILEDAVHRSGDQIGGFTPDQLGAAVKAATDKGRYARGAEDRLRELASAGKAALNPRIPKTGVQALMSWGPMPSTMVGPAAVAMNQPAMRARLLGQALRGASESAPVVAAPVTEVAAQQNAVAEALRNRFGRDLPATAGRLAGGATVDGQVRSRLSEAEEGRRRRGLARR